jgi:hypothetical protein
MHEDFCDVIILVGNIAEGIPNLIEFMQVLRKETTTPVLFSLSNYDFLTNEKEISFNEIKLSLIEACDKYNFHWLHIMGPASVDDVFITGLDTWSTKSGFTGKNVVVEETELSLADHITKSCRMQALYNYKVVNVSDDYLHLPYHMMVSWITMVEPEGEICYQYQLSGNSGNIAGTTHDNKTRVISIGKNWHFYVIKVGEEDAVYSEGFQPMEGASKSSLYSSWIDFDSTMADPAESGDKTLH